MKNLPKIEDHLEGNEPIVFFDIKTTNQLVQHQSLNIEKPWLYNYLQNNQTHETNIALEGWLKIKHDNCNKNNCEIRTRKPK